MSRKEFALIIILCVLCGWVAVVARDPRLLELKAFSYRPRAINEEGEPYKLFRPNYAERYCSRLMDSGREKAAMKILLHLIQRDEAYDDDGAIMRSSFMAWQNTDRIWRYLRIVDMLSLYIRLGEKTRTSSTDMSRALSGYLEKAGNPATLLDYVVQLEFDISYGDRARVDKDLLKLKRYLHANSWNPVEQLPFLYYYPYLKGRHLLYLGRYGEAAGYFELAMTFRKERNGVAASELLRSYLLSGRPDKARETADNVLARPRETPEFSYFKSVLNEK